MNGKKKVSAKSSEVAYGRIPPGPAWQMDPSLCYLAERFGLDPKLGTQFDKLLIKYHRECARAKIDLYVAIEKLIDQIK